jgi:hypothetical protein
VAAVGEVEQIQNGGRCHGNQGAKNVKFTSNFTKFCSNVSCHIHILLSTRQKLPHTTVNIPTMFPEV